MANKINLEHVYIPDTKSLHEWLLKNHDRSPGIWLVFDKQKDGVRALPYSDIVDEGLCFGWIDSLPNKVSETQSKILFTPRKAKSPWSMINKNKVIRLISENRMQPGGLAKIEQAKQDGSWEIYDSVERLEIPNDLQKALDSNHDAKTNFESFSDSVKKGILWWVKSAKTEPTRQKRVQIVVEKAKENKRALLDK